MIEVPSVENFIHGLQRCRKNRDVAKAKGLYAQVCNNGLEAHRAVGNYVIPMLVECGSVADAQQVFDRLVHRNVHSWTSLMLGYLQCGHPYHSLNLYQEMQKDNVPPSSYTLMALLKACSSLRDKEMGRELHLQISESTLHSHIYVGNALIDMYAKCGLLSEAQTVLNTLPTRNVVTWNALISGYAGHGSCLEALNCFEHMQLQGILPNAATFVCALKACASTGAIDRGREMHIKSKQMGFEQDLFVGSTLVDMYARHGLLLEALEVLHKLPSRSVVTWNALISGYTAHGYAQEAWNALEEMQAEGIVPNEVTFVCILKACGVLGDTDRGRAMHIEIQQKGFERNVYVATTLVDMYAKCGSLSEAHKVFDNLPIRGVISWNALIAGYAEHGPGQEALNCFELMQLEGVFPNEVTYASVLKACACIRAIDKGCEVHTKIIRQGFGQNLLVGSSLVDMYAKCGLLSEAHEVFERLPGRDTVTWNALIAGYVEHNSGQDVLDCFEQMQLDNVAPDHVTFVNVLKACSSIHAMEKGKEIHAQIKRKGFEEDIFIGNTLIDMYVKCGSLLEARNVLDNLQVRDVVSWNALIAGYAEFGLGQEAFDCLEQMQTEGVFPDAFTIACILKVCGNTGSIEKGRELYHDIMHKGLESDRFISSTLIDMYAKCGLLSEAREVFDKLQVKDIVSWNAMIRGYGMNHEAKMAAQCFQEMQQKNVKPTAVTFTCLLTACSRASLVLKGQEYFKVMQAEHGIVPTVDHYTCIVDLLARSGILHEAESFLENMPCSPSIETWRSLLSACRTYGNIELGAKCFQQLIQRNPENAVLYVLMANIYANAGRKDDAHGVEELRKLAGAKKKPANALIEVNKKVHEFVVGGSKSIEISAMLDVLSSSIKKDEHMPNLALVSKFISDEEKEEALCQHAERLAIAFGLLNTPQGQTLCVTKNMRMCNNCHDANKSIAHVVKREIIVRDSYTVHHFKDGSCSCTVVL